MNNAQPATDQIYAYEHEVRELVAVTNELQTIMVSARQRIGAGQLHEADDAMMMSRLIFAWTIKYDIDPNVFAACFIQTMRSNIAS